VEAGHPFEPHNERLERMASFHPFGSRLREYWTAKVKRGSGPAPSFSSLFAEEMSRMADRRNEWLKRLKEKGTAGDE